MHSSLVLARLFVAGLPFVTTLVFGACTTTASGCRCHLDSFLEETLAGSYTTTSGSDGYATSLSLPGGQGAIEQTLCPSSTVMQVVVEELGMYPDTTLLVPGGGN